MMEPTNLEKEIEEVLNNTLNIGQDESGGGVETWVTNSDEVTKQILKLIDTHTRQREKELLDYIFSKIPTKDDPMTREEIFLVLENLYKELSNE